MAAFQMVELEESEMENTKGLVLSFKPARFRIVWFTDFGRNWPICLPENLLEVVTNQFSRVALNERCSFFGNVSLGSSVSLSELREIYNVVVLAYGAESDRVLRIPGEGNVALDVARILLRPTMELATTDIAFHVLDALEEKVYLVGRRGSVQAACTAKELREVLGIKDLYVNIQKADMLKSPEDEACLLTLKLNMLLLTDVVIAPPFVYIEQVKNSLTDRIDIAAQNSWTGKGGAFTREIRDDWMAHLQYDNVCSTDYAEEVFPALKDIGCKWVILGHSERRHVIGEDDQFIGKKAAYALSPDLGLIACIGELLQEREAAKTLINSCHQCPDAVPSWDNVVIAYELVWAIGTGQVATPEQAQEVHVAVRDWLKKNVSAEVASKTRIIYGGSVNGGNCAELAKQEDIDGLLVGGASLKPSASYMFEGCCLITCDGLGLGQINGSENHTLVKQRQMSHMLFTRSRFMDPVGLLSAKVDDDESHSSESARFDLQCIPVSRSLPKLDGLPGPEFATIINSVTSKKVAA
ncbi:unnamed protein product [Ilex paraguariensis]|uniref:Triose-phosphate isomerase n=1 Tax=Ilex paraguariensis TaxID=185542 RepID=A0ABC8QZZ5_9AQUA